MLYQIWVTQQSRWRSVEDEEEKHIAVIDQSVDGFSYFASLEGNFGKTIKAVDC